MNDRTQIISTEIIPANDSSKWKLRLTAAAFLAVSSVAMIGWIIALGWAATRFAEWLFS